ncbi:hypothetical protein [Rasiella sp. SM2506]|uniref:hypothetical protein n=1 Tax=Rasiella sp. SM2506 TaxID=3423914 RepID=UPI003D7BBC36
MKKLMIMALVVFGFGLHANAQEEKNAIGLRLGDSDGFGTEVSYQRYLDSKHRLEFDLGWRSNKNFNAYRLTGLYQWVWNIDGGFNWYVGAGGGVAQVDFDKKDNFPGNDDTETYVYAAGDIGIEYDFDFPLLLSLDFRPEFGFGDVNDDVDFDIALGVRYQF